ncbi:MAG: hypothetical protein AB1473_06405 [Thermodesulfobacteriota bacterium]
MRNFDFYEFAALIGPGTIVLACFSVLYPSVSEQLFAKNLGAGNLGVFLIVAYMAGSLVQAVGNFIEWVWWIPWGGKPTDWLRTHPTKLLAVTQESEIAKRLPELLDPGTPFSLGELNRADWHSITRQIQAEVARQGHSQRLDVFTGSYGLNRGLASSLLIACAITAISQWPNIWWPLLLLALSLVALYRMHRFGTHYARELFVQFLQLPPKNSKVGAT